MGIAPWALGGNPPYKYRDTSIFQRESEPIAGKGSPTPRSNPPEISEETRRLWAEAEQRFKETEEAKSYLKATGKYSQTELDKLDLDQLKQEVHDEALRQQVGNNS